MKNILLVILIGLAIWQYFNPIDFKNKDPKVQIASFFGMDGTGAKQSKSLPQNGQFTCDNERQFCRDMRTQAEAAFFYQHCPNQQIEVDTDGTPCGQFFK